MKKDIHPPYYPNAQVKCACGNTFTVGSTKEFMEIEICSSCHPFYCGKERLVDTMGRVERFKKRLAKKAEMGKKVKKVKKIKKVISPKEVISKPRFVAKLFDCERGKAGRRSRI